MGSNAAQEKQEGNKRMIYHISFPYRDVTTDHWTSQLEQRLMLVEMGAKIIAWKSGRLTPANWNGYNENNPSPGVDLNWHFWEIEAEPECMMMLALKVGAEIVKQ